MNSDITDKDELEAIRERVTRYSGAVMIEFEDWHVLEDALDKIDADAKLLADTQETLSIFKKEFGEMENDLYKADELLDEGREIVRKDAEYWEGKLTNWQGIVGEMNIKDPDLEDAFQERVDVHNDWLKKVK